MNINIILVLLIIVGLIIYFFIEKNKHVLFEKFTVIDKNYFAYNCKRLTLENIKIDKAINTNCINKINSNDNKSNINEGMNCYDKVSIKTVLETAKDNFCNMISKDERDEIEKDLKNIYISDFEGPDFINTIDNIEKVEAYHKDDYSPF